MTKADLLQMFLEYVLPPLVIAVLGALTALIVKGAQFVHEKAATNKLFAAIAVVTDVIASTVAELNAAVKAKLPGYLADGVLDEDEKRELKTTALTIVKSKLPSPILGILELAMGPALDTWLGGRIEQAVAQQKVLALPLVQAKALAAVNPAANDNAPVPQSP